MMAKKSIQKRIAKHLPRSMRKRWRVLLTGLETLSGIRSGSRASRVIRHILEKINLKAILGGNLAFAVLSTGLISPVASIDPKMAESTLLPLPAINLSTEILLRYPVEKAIINQAYSRFHYGLDIDGEIDDPVYPIMKGKIELKESSRFGYGNQIIIDHGNGLKSRYAHMSKINVEIGQKVTTNNIIGTVGTTGWSTGPHLHLEIIQNNHTINPQIVLSKN